ncbi:oligosaccharide flippase family protein [Peptoclostridium acidaminophilum]|nr:oligosaccharide flippase family protein [Peptoclostridium acidaminophilum]
MKGNLMIRTGGIYLGLSLISNFINLILTPIYTNSLTLEEYGSYSIISSYQSLFSIFATLGIYSGMKRFFNEYEDKNRLKNIALTFSIVWGIIVVALNMIFARQLAGLVFESGARGGVYIRYVVTSSVLSCIISIYTAYYSMQYKALKASLIEIVKLALTLAFTLIFVVSYDGGITGILRSQCLSFAILLLALIWADHKNITPVWGKSELKDMLSYGVGMAGASDVLEWVLTLIDRYFLKVVAGYAAVAVYSIGYKVGMLILPLFIAPFTNALTPFKYGVYKEENGKRKLEEIFDHYNIIGWFMVLGISVYANTAIKILATEEYSQAFRIVPLIVIAYLLDGSCEFYSLGIHIEKKMALNLIIPGAATAINIALNMALIPGMGAYGAAIATIVSYFAMTVMYYFGGRAYYKMNIGLFSFLKAGIPFMMTYSLYLYFGLYELGVLAELFFNTALVAVYFIICFLFGFIPKSYVGTSISFARELFSKREVIEDED